MNTFSQARGSNKTNTTLGNNFERPVVYNGVEITTAKDLLDNFKLESFHDSMN